MPQRPITIYPDPILRRVATAVTSYNTELHTLLDDMAETMYAANGIGLAAPQVGASQRVIVIDVSQRDGALDLIELVNPVLTLSEIRVDSEEGCLSIPEYRDTIIRSETVKVDAYTRLGDKISFAADNLLAICLQHEVDHLDGVLFVDRLSRLKREFFRRWHRRAQADKDTGKDTGKP